ncbi:hypothetical protein [Clostridium ganghwense]|uniref:Lipoprotein n=1 Tax=Clostridium ganghwense TaxID=312089 RepID=A0ABT4CPK7_9CLOT|nr:hypothetical protein [Clostridium ganghwense]MCY6370986.1 hypothetical protein [Clostridium ganghwense]
MNKKSIKNIATSLVIASLISLVGCSSKSNSSVKDNVKPVEKVEAVNSDKSASDKKSSDSNNTSNKKQDTQNKNNTSSTVKESGEDKENKSSKTDITAKGTVSYNLILGDIVTITLPKGIEVSGVNVSGNDLKPDDYNVTGNKVVVPSKKDTPIKIKTNKGDVMVTY